jgi:hypothetical protein
LQWLFPRQSYCSDSKVHKVSKKPRLIA